VRLTEENTRRRIWVEFEVSRADPVANHAKFATAALLEGMTPNDTFVSMTSNHIAPGRAALAAGTTIWMRSLGIPAFQIALLPQFDESAIRTLNAQALTVPDDSNRLAVEAEVNRVIEVSDATALHSGHRIHKADNAYSVQLNVRQWNAEVSQPEGRTLWGRRRVRYFVFDPSSELFAPAKFCAFIPGPIFRGGGANGMTSLPSKPNSSHGMTMSVYAQLGEQDRRFDGNVARTHLQTRLQYRSALAVDAEEPLARLFNRWVLKYHDSLLVTANAVLLHH
jgi:hypothetical protein